MAYKKFYINIIIRILLIVATSIWLSFVIGDSQKIYTLIIVIALLLIQTISTINYFNRFNQELFRFFSSLHDHDSSYKLSGEKFSKTNVQIAELLNNTSELLTEARIEKEKQLQYLQFVVEKLSIGIISYSPRGEIKIINDAFLNQIDLKNLGSIDEIKEVESSLHRLLQELKSGEQAVLKAYINKKFQILLVEVSQFVFENEQLKLASLKDFKTQYEENELESWKKLIRILTHEIMNSLTPINTLTHAIKRELEETQNDNTKKNIVTNVSLIEDRTKGIIDFIQKFKSIEQLSEINISDIELNSFLGRIQKYFTDELMERKINLEYHIEADKIILKADKNFLEQVFINIIKNSIDALQNVKAPKIEIQAELDSLNKTTIKISDNGIGIPVKNMDQVFVPFFTTKDHGSGIGLSLCRQIMQLHKGNIKVLSKENEGTTFILEF